MLYFRSISADDGEEDLSESIVNYKSAAMCLSGPPRIRLQAAIEWARRLKENCPESPEVIHAYDSALGLIALIAGLEETVQTRFTQQGERSTLAHEASSAAFGEKLADKALEWLEQGRCLVWGQLTNLRTPLDDLRESDRESDIELAERI